MRVSVPNDSIPHLHRLIVSLHFPRAKQSNRDNEVRVAKPGWITAPTFSTRSLMAFVMKVAVSMPSVTVSEISASMIDQVLKGFDKEPLLNENLVRFGRQVLSCPS